MTKEETLQLKGIAIMLMLWLHLFGTSEEILNRCVTLVYLWNGDPLIYAMRKLGRMCIVFYIFLGGYGLAKTYEKRGSAMQNGRRVLSLMLNYWLVFIPFVAVASLVKPDTYPGSFMTLLANAVGMSSTYNETWWFLLPYALLTLVSYPLLRFVYTLSWRWEAVFMVACFVLNAGLYSLRDDGPDTMWSMMLQVLVNMARFLFVFCGAALFARHRWLEALQARWRGARLGGVVPMWALLLLLAFLRLVVGASTMIDPWFLVPMVVLYLCTDRPLWVCRILEYLGTHSTNIWFVHVCLLILTGTLITCFRFPLLIFVILLDASLLCSHVLKWALRHVKAWIGL